MARFVLFLVISAALLLGYSVYERGGELVIETEPSSRVDGMQPFAWKLFDRLELRPRNQEDSSAFRASKMCRWNAPSVERDLRGGDGRANL